MFNDFFEALDDNPFEETPVDTRTFVQSLDYLGQPPLSEIQYEIVDAMSQIYKKQDLERIMGPVEGARYYDKLFEEEKKKKEDSWNFTRNYFLYEYSKSMEEFDIITLKSVKGVKPTISLGFTYTNFDIMNLSHYSKHLDRIVLRKDEKTGQVLKLKECWTYDGRWRQGYWTSDYDYSDKNWREKTMNQFIDTTKGDIQP